MKEKLQHSQGYNNVTEKLFMTGSRTAMENVVISQVVLTAHLEVTWPKTDAKIVHFVSIHKRTK